MSVIAATAINNDEDLTLDKKTWDKLKNIDIDEAQGIMPVDSESEEEENLQELRYKFHTDGGNDKFAALDKKEGGEDDSDSISEDEEVTRIDRMALEIDESLKAQKEYAMLIDKKQAKKNRKAKAIVELQRQKRMDESDDEKLANTDLLTSQVAKPAPEEESENDDDLEEEREIQRIIEERRQLKKQKIAEEEEEEKQLFLNPLLAFKNREGAKTGAKGDDDSEEWSDDDKYDPKLTKE